MQSISTRSKCTFSATNLGFTENDPEHKKLQCLWGFYIVHVSTRVRYSTSFHLKIQFTDNSWQTFCNLSSCPDDKQEFVTEQLSNLAGLLGGVGMLVKWPKDTAPVWGSGGKIFSTEEHWSLAQGFGQPSQHYSKTKAQYCTVTFSICYAHWVLLLHRTFN